VLLRENKEAFDGGAVIFYTYCMKKRLILALFFVYFLSYAMHEHCMPLLSDHDRIVYAIESGSFACLRRELEVISNKHEEALDVTVLVNQLVACMHDRWNTSRRLAPVAVCLGGGVPLLDYSCGVAACLTSVFLCALSKDCELRSDFYERSIELLCTARGVTFDRIRLTSQAREFVLLIEQRNK
jgi:hypothetical protein